MSTAWRWLSRLLMVLLVFMALLAAIALMQQDEAVDPSAENGFPLMMALPPAPGPLPAGVNCGNESTSVGLSFLRYSLLISRMRSSSVMRRLSSEMCLRARSRSMHARTCCTSFRAAAVVSLSFLLSSET